MTEDRYAVLNTTTKRIVATSSIPSLAKAQARHLTHATRQEHRVVPNGWLPRH